MKCPNCGEPVSQFAAGCAVCGADLEAHRASRAQRRTVPVPQPRVRLPVDWWLYVGTAAIALFFPLAGLAVAFLAGRQRYGRERTFFIVCGVVSVVLLAIPSLRLGLAELVAS
jgi:hypothetical protein